MIASLWVILWLSQLDVILPSVDSVAKADTSIASLTVQTGVIPNCTVESAAVSFPSYDPLVVNLSSPLDGTGTLIVRCTPGSNATLLLNQGSYPASASTDSAPERRMSDGAGHYLTYFLFTDVSRTTGWGNTVATGRAYLGTGTEATFTVYGRIPGGQVIPSGVYDDTVLATITF